MKVYLQEFSTLLRNWNFEKCVTKNWSSGTPCDFYRKFYESSLQILIFESEPTYIKIATNRDGLLLATLWYITTESDSSLIFWDNTSPCGNKNAPSKRISTDCVAGLPDAPITTKKSPFKSHWGSTRKPHLFQITDPNRPPPIIVERIHEAESIDISFVID